jgi:hypothetical protein
MNQLPFVASEQLALMNQLVVEVEYSLIQEIHTSYCYSYKEALSYLGLEQ